MSSPLPLGPPDSPVTPTDLQEIQSAIERLEPSLTSPLSGNPHPAFQAVHHDRLADLYFSKYNVTGAQADFESAKTWSSKGRELGRQAIQSAPPGHSNAAQWCALQGSRLSLRHERFGEHQDLDEAIETYEEALGRLPDGSGLRSIVLTNQANCLCTRFEETGSTADVDDAIHKAKEALAMGGPNTVTILNDLSTMYLSRYEKENDVGDLEEAIKLARDAVGRTREDDGRLPMRLLNLANALNARYELHEQVRYVEEEIETLRKAERAGKACQATCLPQILSRLAHALYVRYTRTTTAADVLAALEKGREGLALATETGHHEIRHRLGHLVNTCSEEARDLEEGEDEDQEAVAAVEV